MLGTAIGVVVVEAALLGALFVASRRENTAAVINTVGMLALTLVPAVFGWAGAGGQHLAAVLQLTLAVGVAGFLHSLGMLGLYESSDWWDHLTHTLSATLAAALLYAVLLARSPGGASTTIAAWTLLGTFALGAGWEILELAAREAADRYGIEPVLVHYGRRDTVLDLLFDIVGALLVVTLDVRLFHPLVESLLQAVGLT